MLDLVDLTSTNFDRFQYHIMASEEIFAEEMRESRDDYLDALMQSGAMGIVAFHEDCYVGNVLGFSPAGDYCRQLQLEGSSELIYLFNIVTMPQFQNQGFGRELLHNFIGRAADGGFSRLGGHFRGNGSLKNFISLGGRPLSEYANWFGSGETYTYCELELRA